MGNIFEDAWDWGTGAADTIIKKGGRALGLTDESSEVTKNRGPDGPYATPYDGFNADAYDPTKQQGYDSYGRAAGQQGQQGTQAYGAGFGAMQQGWSAPNAGGPQQYSQQQPIRANEVQTYPTNAYGAQSRVDDRFGDATRQRSEQSYVGRELEGWARGQGPSVGADMQRENASTAAAAFGTAGSMAGQGYRAAARDANAGYADAVAQQQYEAQRAGTDAARSVMTANEDAIRRQAGLASMSRGNNMGLGLLQASNNAALQTRDAGFQAGQIYSDTVRDAGFQAAGAQRQLSAQQQTQADNLMATAERAGIEAARAQEAGDYRAAQIASQEQQSAMQLWSEMTSTTRGMDIDEQASALAAQQTALEIDKLMQAGDFFNAEQALKASGMSAEQAYQYDALNAEQAVSYAQMNGDWESANNILMSDVAKTLATMGVEMQVTELASLAGIVAMNLASGMALEDAKFAAFDNAKNRGANFDIGATNTGLEGKKQNMDMIGGVASALTGGLIGGGGGGGAAAGGGGGGAAALIPFVGSDETAKDILGESDDYDFRGAKSFSYRYKPGAFTRPDGTDEYDPEEEFTGPMAQALPKSVTFKDEKNGGKLKVDVGRLALLQASAIGELQRRLDEVDDWLFNEKGELEDESELSGMPPPSDDPGDWLLGSTL